MLKVWEQVSRHKNPKLGVLDGILMGRVGDNVMKKGLLLMMQREIRVCEWYLGFMDGNLGILGWGLLGSTSKSQIGKEGS